MKTNQVTRFICGVIAIGTACVAYRLSELGEWFCSGFLVVVLFLMLLGIATLKDE